jgi:cephalosporin hydroxylase
MMHAHSDRSLSSSTKLSCTNTVEGWLDHNSDAYLEGWAWFPAIPSQVAHVEVWCDDRLCATAEASEYRGDLRAAGKRDGFCGFTIPANLTDENARVYVRTVDGLEMIANGDLRVHPRERAGSCSVSTVNPDVVGHVDAWGPETVSGWVQNLAQPSARLQLELLSEGEVVAQFVAATWRQDLAELRQGDGRWGFEVPVPNIIRDEDPHHLELRLVGSRNPILTAESNQVFAPPRVGDASAAAPVSADVSQQHVEKSRDRGPPELSILVNFYNMRREAERTLFSLSRDYQRDVENLTYEVICVDNGSIPPLDADWIKSFGPEFRLVRPVNPLSSPCQAINLAARTASGRQLGVMIDGAHLLTPGVLAEAAAQARLDPSAVIALRHWFVGGDQRWLSVSGYSRKLEDILFDRINWPCDGYELFRIGSPIGDSPNSWLDGLSETNCLFLPTKLWQQLGGMEEAFDEPGGGFANLDLFRRVAMAAPDKLICLIGEATFHQFHGGSTTNVGEAEKERRVASYAQTYKNLRGCDFEALDPREFRVAGRIRSEHASIVRQRPLFPTPIGVTAAVRPALRHQVFDSGAERYLQSAYVELGLHRKTRWLGTPIEAAPTDLISILGIMRTVRPTCVVTTSHDRGLLNFIDSACTLLDLDGTQIVIASEQPVVERPGRSRLIDGDPWASSSLREIEREIETSEEVLVLFEPPSAPGAPTVALANYAEFVSFGSYLIYLGTSKGQPWLGYSTQWPLKAIRQLTERSARYAVDYTFDRQLVTTSPSGYIRRIGGLVELENDDTALETLDAL